MGENPAALRAAVFSLASENLRGGGRSNAPPAGRGLRSLPDCVKRRTLNSVPKPMIPLRLNLVMNQPNFPRFAYNKFVEIKQTELTQSHESQKQKWMRDIGCFAENNFLVIAIVTHSARIRMFHYKLVSRILSTNRFLKIINIKDDDRCTFCFWLSYIY